MLSCFVAVSAISVSAFAFASDYKAGSIEVHDPWSRATPKGASTAIGYMVLKNDGSTPDRFTGASVDVADRVELHSMTMENGISKMRELDGIEIRPGQTISLKPGGSHAMFVGLKHPLKQGERVKGTLTFERAGTVRIEYTVEGIGARQPMQHMPAMSH
jgi:copper(I)-binding protein